MAASTREKIFVGFIDYTPQGEMPPGILLRDDDSPMTANSIPELVSENAPTLGENWEENVSLKLPTTRVLTDGVNTYRLKEFVQCSIDLFKEEMEKYWQRNKTRS